MARTISDEEQQLKRRARRRLIGAIVLVAAIVVVLPMVLDSEPKPSGQTVSVQIPSPDAGGLTAKPAPVTPAPQAQEAPKAPDQPTPAKPVAEEPKKPVAATPAPAPQEAPKEEPKPVAKAEPEKPAKPAAQPAAQPVTKPAAKAPAKPDGKYVVQVIALADAGRAKQMQEQIAAAGIPSYTEVVKTSKGDVTRVRAGPFASREAADKARDQLKSLGLNGNVTTR